MSHSMWFHVPILRLLVFPYREGRTFSVLSTECKIDRADLDVLPTI